MKKFIVLLMAITLAAVLAACNDDGESADKNESKDKDKQNEQASQQQQMPKPDLEGVPKVVAEVNGEEITKDEFESTYQGQFQRMAMQAQMTGQELDQDKLRKQTAEGMVGTELLIQEANNRNFDITEKDTNETLDELAKQNQLESKDKFLSALKEQGMKKDEIMSQVETQVKLEKLIDEESGDIKPTNKELQDAYDQWKEQRKQFNKENEEDKEIASFDEMKSDLKAQVKNQKKQQATQTLIEKLREDADVTINI